MAVILVCTALVLLGVALVVRWGDRAKAQPSFVHAVGLALAAGVAAGVLAAGAGGRLVMRLLAATSPDVRGSFTEAEAIVGQITVEGTLGFILFAGAPAGVLCGALYALVAPALPRGRAGGVALGAIALVLAGSRLDPLRRDNIDFALLGPAWLAVLSFSALAVFHGMVVAAVAGRLGGRWSAPSRRVVIVIRVVLGVAVALALPGFVIAVADILG